MIEAMNQLPSTSIKSKAILLYDLNEDMKSQYLDNYKSEKVKIELQENENFLEYLNKIRDLINTSLNINSSIDENDEKNILYQQKIKNSHLLKIFGVPP